MPSFLAGQVLTADDLNVAFPYRVGTTTITADSSTFTTTETEVSSITVSLVTGRVYRITAYIGWGSTASGDAIRCRLREDTVSGTLMNSSQVNIGQVTTTGAYHTLVVAEYTAVSTGSKTFVVSGDQEAGSGTCRMEHASDRPGYITVDFIRVP